MHGCTSPLAKNKIFSEEGLHAQWNIHFPNPLHLQLCDASRTPPAAFSGNTRLDCTAPLTPSCLAQTRPPFAERDRCTHITRGGHRYSTPSTNYHPEGLLIQPCSSAQNHFNWIRFNAFPSILGTVYAYVKNCRRVFAEWVQHAPRLLRVLDAPGSDTRFRQHVFARVRNGAGSGLRASYGLSSDPSKTIRYGQEDTLFDIRVHLLTPVV